VLATETRYPVSAIDPFSDEFLANPYPYHHELREAGPVVRLEHYGVWAMARHEQVFAALADWQTFSSGAGVGIDDFRKVRPWRPKSLLLEVDPPLHTRTRTVMNRVLSGPALRGLRETFGAEAAKLADRLVVKRRFDAIADLAEAYPLQVFPDAVGLRPDGRENLLPYGNMLFNSFGPRNALFRQSEAAAKPVLEWIYESCAREKLASQGFGAAIWAAFDRGEIEESEAHILVRALLTAGLDTTVNGLGSAILAFATFPEQWQTLRDDKSLLKVAFDEVLRWESPVQTFFRTTTRAVSIESIEIPRDAKVLLFLASANRDPRRWDEPEKFDIRRRPTGHVALGNGIHVCVGQMVARLEAEMMLGALAERVKRFDIVGEPKRKLNNTLRSLATLPVEVTPL
jgi:4-methoxybenzoate monooxygenase (O-demethylating)